MLVEACRLAGLKHAPKRRRLSQSQRDISPCDGQWNESAHTRRARERETEPADMADQRNVRDTLETAFADQEMLEACKGRDVGAIIRILKKYGITQGQIESLTGIPQGRISEYKN